MKIIWDLGLNLELKLTCGSALKCRYTKEGVNYFRKCIIFRRNFGEQGII